MGDGVCRMTRLRYGDEYCQMVAWCDVVDMARRDGVGRQPKQPELCVLDGCGIVFASAKEMKKTDLRTIPC